MKRIFSLLIVLMLALPTVAGATGSGITPVEGGDGVKVEIGTVGTLDLGKDFFYLNKEDVKKFSTMQGNILSGQEIAGIGPIENQDWFVYFDYVDSGHIKNAEKEKIKPDKLLKQIKEGTEAQNEEKAASDHIFVTGWDVEPFYDHSTKNLTWSLLLENAEKKTFVNYEVRLLTREGYISVVLVSDSENRKEAAAILSNEILPKFSAVQGERYEDFDESTDKVAEMGLTGLILGGAGLAVAKKVGLLLLLKKFWYVIVAVIVGVFNWLRKKTRRSKDETQETSSTTQETQGPDHPVS
ncbi:DUF2167 domain-containing protein [Paenibacillus sp. N3/727]|uniref:DUF2167 domain-containing protein n=1 Tax=Paenibacillus sp. N3/727 TaxID=2925845 RepID=UPI001F52C927|nr:DUF2167 domain-containing protein [Paenibacillus sp. N3/727]UNK17615.1 DUF2167 domain-containing protein [Paenibacillus sp. N3/727]